VLNVNASVNEALHRGFEAALVTSCTLTHQRFSSSWRAPIFGVGREQLLEVEVLQASLRLPGEAVDRCAEGTAART